MLLRLCVLRHLSKIFCFQEDFALIQNFYTWLTVIVTLTVTNRIDQVLAQRGFISSGKVRSYTLDDVLVDTGATLLCLPASIISQLGLVQGGEAQVETAAGVKQGRIFRDVELSIAERQGTFDCLELTEVPYALLGVTPMEVLGLEPDLWNQL